LSCQPQQTSTTLSESDMSAVMEATTRYGTSIVNKDIDNLRSLMAPTIVFMPPGEQSLQGIDAAIQFIETRPPRDGNISPEQINGSGNQAFVRGTYDLNFLINDTTRISDNGKYIEVWEKQDDGSWKVVVEIWNSSISAEM